MMKRTVTAVVTALGLAGLCAPVSAEISADQIARLDKDLTPLGAIRAGNEAGTIPAWEPASPTSSPASTIPTRSPAMRCSTPSMPPTLPNTRRS